MTGLSAYILKIVEQSDFIFKGDRYGIAKL